MTTTTESAVKPKRFLTRRQWVNGSIWLAVFTYWQLVATPVAHFAILAMPTNRSILEYMGKGHTWLETFGEGWGLIGSELFGVVLTALSAAGLFSIVGLTGAIIKGIYRSLLPVRPPSDDD